jgi:hypothetical protein
LLITSHEGLLERRSKGAIIASAHLSNKVLGLGNVKETRVKLDSGTVDFDWIMKSINARLFMKCFYSSFVTLGCL